MNIKQSMKNIHPVLFDTSTWVLLINEQKNISINKLLEQGVVPFITMEVFLELMNVSKEKRDIRMEYLKNVSRLATFRYKSEILGSFVDLRCLEYINILTEKGNLTEYLLKNIVVFHGKELVALENIDLDAFQADQRSMHLSLSQSSWKFYNDPQIRNKKLKDIVLKTHVSEDEFKVHVEKVVSSLINNGDRKRKETERREAATKFGLLMHQKFSEMGQNENPIINAMNELGIKEAEIDAEETLGDLINNIEYRKKLLQVSELTNCLIDDLIKVNKEDIISWFLEKSFQTEYERMLLTNIERNAESSSITDKRLCCYTYVFPVFVDKRTREIMDIISKKTSIKLSYIYINSVESFLNEIRKLTTGST